jgi:hypothetical protein
MAYLNRKQGAELVTRECFPCAARTTIGWKDLPLVYLNGYATATEENWRKAGNKRLKQMLAKQNADEVGVLQSAKRALAGAKAARERKLKAEEKLRRARRQRAEVALTT